MAGGGGVHKKGGRKNSEDGQSKRNKGRERKTLADRQSQYKIIEKDMYGRKWQYGFHKPGSLSY